MSAKRNPYKRPSDERFFGDIGGLKPNMSASAALATVSAPTAPVAPYNAAAWQTIINDFTTELNLIIAEVNLHRTAMRNS